MSAVKAEIVNITPEWAQDVLEKHSKSMDEGKFRQRPIVDRVVAIYASDMRSGRWVLNGQGISFDEDGNLIDGQHRVAAVVRAGVEVPMLVLVGLPKESTNGTRTIDTFDIGRKRQLAAQLKIDGFEYYTQIASAARMALMFAVGGHKQQFSQPQGLAISGLLKNNFLEVIQILNKDCAPSYRWNGTIVCPIALLGTADKDAAMLFATEFNEMANLGKTSPVLQFDKFLQRPTHTKGGTDYQLHVAGGLCCALRAYTEERRLDVIRSSNQDNIEWLIKKCKNIIQEIRKVAGIKTSVEELQKWEGKQ